MKKSLLISALILILFACKSKTNQQENSTENDISKIGLPAVIEGKILNQDVYPHVKTIELIIADFDGRQTEYIADIPASGEFRFEFYPKTKREIKLRPIEDVLIIAPGDSLYVITDFEDIGNTIFSGTGAQLNKEISLFRNQYLGRYSDSNNESYFEFKEICEKKKKENIDKMLLFKQKHNASNDFEYWAKKQMELDFSRALFRYPSHYFLQTGEDFENQEAYYTFIADLESVFDDSIVVSDYFELSKYLLGKKKSPFLGEHLKLKNNLDSTLKGEEFEHSFIANKIDNTENYLNLYNSFINNDSTISSFMQEIMDNDNNYAAQFILYAFLDSDLKSNSTKLYETHKDFIESNVTDPFLSATLTEQYLQVKEYLENPKKLSNAILNDKPGDFSSKIAVKNNLVKKIINENPDKVLYIDIWKPGCAPDVLYKKYSKKMAEHFSEDDVEFINISLSSESNKNEVQKLIKKLEIGGKHYFPNEEEMTDLRKRFNGYPRFLLIDKEGTLVDFGNHINPANPVVKEKIENLLEK